MIISYLPFKLKFINFSNLLYIDFKIKYLKYKKKYVDLKGNGQSVKIISYKNYDGKDFFNIVQRYRIDFRLSYNGKT